MAGGLPPPPTKDPSGSFAWVDYFQRLNIYLSQGNSVPWSVINKAGSKLSDLASRAHNDLTAIAGTGQTHISAGEGTFLTNLLSLGHAALSSILGTGQYHVSASEASRLTATYTLNSLVGAPTTTDIPLNTWALYKNTTLGTTRLWVNDNGTLKSVALV